MSRGATKLPDRWIRYDPVGKPIDNSRFVPFKCPLDDKFFASRKELAEEDIFTIEILVDMASRAGKKIGLVVDLTNTYRYYEPDAWRKHNIEHFKLRCPGQEIDEREDLVEKFISRVDQFVCKYPDPNMLIGVHCTHGLNRTGYLIGRYLIEREGWKADEFINLFEKCRGHPMEREAYMEKLRFAQREKEIRDRATVADPYNEKHRLNNLIREQKRAVVEEMTDGIRFVGVDSPLPFFDAPGPDVPTSSVNANEPKEIEEINCNNNTNDVQEERRAPRPLPPPPSTPHSSSILVTCPYSMEHRFNPSEFNSHLISCRKQYISDHHKTLVMRRCKFNGRHFLPEAEIGFHEKTCNDTFFKRIYSEMSCKPERWLLPERENNHSDILCAQNKSVRLATRRLIQKKRIVYGFEDLEIDSDDGVEEIDENDEGEEIEEKEEGEEIEENEEGSEIEKKEEMK